MTAFDALALVAVTLAALVLWRAWCIRRDPDYAHELAREYLDSLVKED